MVERFCIKPWPEPSPIEFSLFFVPKGLSTPPDIICPGVVPPLSQQNIDLLPAISFHDRRFKKSGRFSNPFGLLSISTDTFVSTKGPGNRWKGKGVQWHHKMPPPPSHSYRPSLRQSLSALHTAPNRPPPPTDHRPDNPLPVWHTAPNPPPPITHHRRRCPPSRPLLKPQWLRVSCGCTTTWPPTEPQVLLLPKT